ncbi:MAG TPA: helix-turn-helix transcriptional regulator [Myxococcaceae bacterium]|nr:helix-turn-helix transcriptional regulator [Myxococcaceae bacterium]
MGAKTASTGLIIPVLETPTSVAQRLAERVRALRLERGWSRGELAERAGISEETVKSFERRAQITLSRLLLIARALEALDDFLPLFAPRPAGTLSEIETRQRPRVRGRRRKS